MARKKAIANPLAGPAGAAPAQPKKLHIEARALSVTPPDASELLAVLDQLKQGGSRIDDRSLQTIFEQLFSIYQQQTAASRLGRIQQIDSRLISVLEKQALVALARMKPSEAAKIAVRLQQGRRAKDETAVRQRQIAVEVLRRRRLKPRMSVEAVAVIVAGRWKLKSKTVEKIYARYSKELRLTGRRI